MIGLDTNILVRYFTQDDPEQSAKATALMERGLTAREPGFVSLVTLVETTWVLERAYHATVAELAKVIEGMLRAESLLLQHEPEVYAALLVLRSGRSSFADALIGALGTRAGCRATVTFDRKASLLPGFELI